MKTKKIHHYMNKTIHVSAIVLAILILTVGCQGKKGGSRAEDEGSNTVLADSTIQKYSGKAQLPEVNIWTNSVKSAVILLIRSMAVDAALI